VSLPLVLDDRVGGEARDGRIEVSRIAGMMKRAIVGGSEMAI
jgi:hypothetical protein